MRQVRRLDIVQPEPVVRPVLDLRDHPAVLAYTIATGPGGRTRRGLAVAGLADAAVTVICRTNAPEALIADISTFLVRFGGIATASDATGLNIG